MLGVSSMCRFTSAFVKGKNTVLPLPLVLLQWPWFWSDSFISGDSQIATEKESSGRYEQDDAPVPFE